MIQHTRHNTYEGGSNKLGHYNALTNKGWYVMDFLI